MDLKTSIIDNDWIIIQINGKNALIATGINYSLSNERTIEILGKNFTLENQYMGFTIQDMNKQLNIDVNYIIGANILSNFNYSINMQTKIFLLSPDPIKDQSSSMPIRNELDISYFSILIDGKEMSGYFDSLSKYCYINEKNLKNQNVKEEGMDFLVGMGGFRTKTFDVQYTIMEHKVSLITSFYPAVISRSRFISPNKAIIGKELLKNFSLIFNNTQNLLSFTKINP